MATENNDKKNDKSFSWRARLGEDLRRTLSAAALGCAIFAVIELVATLLLTPGDLRAITGLRFAALVVSLAAIAYLVTAPALWLATLGARAVLWLKSPAAEHRYRGLLSPVPIPDTAPEVRAARLFAGAFAAAIYLALSTYFTYYFQVHFTAPMVVALILAGLQLALFAIAAIAWMGLSRALLALARGPARRLGGLSPFSSPGYAFAVIVAGAVIALFAATIAIPQLGPLIPWRYLLAAAAWLSGARAAVALLSVRGRILWPTEHPGRRAVIVAAAVAALTAATLWRIGADPATKYLAVTGSPPMQSLIDLVRAGNDFDGDGYGSLLGENDCYPFNPDRHRGARDIPDNGIDENCSGADFSLKVPASYRTGDVLPVPAAFDRDYNVLLITIDTVRYDHTSFGGYVKKSGRDTTPRLSELVDRSVSFTFANAPSAGTMASVPAILTSKYFHDGIALDENVPPHTPPIIKDENVLLSEIMKSAGYNTGAVVSHYYFDHWNMDQGFDDFTNMNPKRTPYRVTSQIITDLGLAWMSRHSDHKWFLWLHYIDPHGRYVGHPGAVYGKEEKDLYDSEIHYTDKHIGRLLDGLKRMPAADNTVIIITSDHGDGFNEHGFINHGMALYRELLNVPLIIYVPNIEPHLVAGPVSGLDIVPTVAQLGGADVSKLSFEGESLVPQLFYGRDARSRIVFSETNWPRPLRAAISDKYKLIYHLKNNVYELYNLKTDPWEHKNLHATDAKGMAVMKGYLDDWLERVYYARNFVDNQAIGTLKKNGVLLTSAPRPQHPVEPALTFDNGNLEVTGFDVAMGPKNRLEVAVYFHAKKRPSGTFKFRAALYPAHGDARAILGHSEEPAHGLFPTDRWHAGEYVRHRTKIRLPSDFAGGDWRLGLEVRSGHGLLAPSVPLAKNKSAGDLGAVDLAPVAAEGSSPPVAP